MDRLPTSYNSLITWILFPLLFLLLGKICSCTNGSILHTDQLVVHGRVLAGQENGSSEKLQPVSDAKILLARLRSDGSLEVISQKTASTGEQGYFRISTLDRGVRNIFIIDTKEHQEWRGMVESENKNENELLAEPVSYETTIATHLYLSAIQAGRPEMADYSDILESIRTELTIMGYVNGPAFARESLEREKLESKRLREKPETP